MPTTKAGLIGEIVAAQLDGSDMDDIEALLMGLQNGTVQPLHTWSKEDLQSEWKIYHE